MKNEIETIEQMNAHIADNEASMVYFYNDHCAPCLSLRPKVVNLIEKSFPKMKLTFVNSEKFPDLPAGLQVFANPTLIIFFDGKEYRRKSKYVSIQELAAEIDRPYQLIFEN